MSFSFTLFKFGYRIIYKFFAVSEFDENHNIAYNDKKCLTTII